jgi:Sulfotransferase family
VESDRIEPECVVRWREVRPVRPKYRSWFRNGTVPLFICGISVNSFRPIFVVGHPRSGTTLLTALLGRHSEISGTPETHFFSRNLKVALHSTHNDISIIIERLRKVGILSRLKIDLTDFESRLRNESELSPPAIFRLLLMAYAAQHDKAYVVEKTPLHLRHIDEILRWYPDARIIWIVRHSAGCLASLLKVDWATSNIQTLITQWNRNINLGLDFKRRYARNILMVYYESLVAEPEETLRAIHDWVGLPFEATQLEPRLEDNIVLGFERDWKYRVSERISAARASAWCFELSDAVIAEILTCTKRNLRRLNYEVQVGPVRPLRRLLWVAGSFVNERIVFAPIVFRGLIRLRCCYDAIGYHFSNKIH